MQSYLERLTGACFYIDRQAFISKIKWVIVQPLNCYFITVISHTGFIIIHEKGS